MSFPLFRKVYICILGPRVSTAVGRLVVNLKAIPIRFRKTGGHLADIKGLKQPHTRNTKQIEIGERPQHAAWCFRVCCCWPRDRWGATSQNGCIGVTNKTKNKKQKKWTNGVKEKKTHTHTQQIRHMLHAVHRVGRSVTRNTQQQQTWLVESGTGVMDVTFWRGHPSSNSYTCPQKWKGIYFRRKMKEYPSTSWMEEEGKNLKKT